MPAILALQGCSLAPTARPLPQGEVFLVQYNGPAGAAFAHQAAVYPNGEIWFTSARGYHYRSRIHPKTAAALTHQWNDRELQSALREAAEKGYENLCRACLGIAIRSPSLGLWIPGTVAIPKLDHFLAALEEEFGESFGRRYEKSMQVVNEFMRAAREKR